MASISSAVETVKTTSRDTADGTRTGWGGFVDAMRNRYLQGCGLMVLTMVGATEAVDRLHNGDPERHQALATEALVTAPLVFGATHLLRGIGHAVHLRESWTQRLATYGGAIAGVGGMKLGQYALGGETPFDANLAGGETAYDGGDGSVDAGTGKGDTPTPEVAPEVAPSEVPSAGITGIDIDFGEAAILFPSAVIGVKAANIQQPKFRLDGYR